MGIDRQANDVARLQQIKYRLPLVFTPSSPVNSASLFAGREAEITQMIRAIGQPGRHVILFGARGVGKTSLAHIIYEIVNGVSPEVGYLAARINCDAGDTFQSLWAKIAEEVDIQFEKLQAPIREESPAYPYLADLLAENASPNVVRRFFGLIERAAIIVIDEFDRIQDEELRGLIADTIKMLSDHAVSVTLIIVGVASDVDDLLYEHASIPRHIEEVLMPVMPVHELEELVASRLKSVGMGIDDEALTLIALLSQGLPPYAHLLGLYASLSAVNQARFTVGMSDLDAGLRETMTQAAESVASAYRQATMSNRPENLYEEVLLACALASCDELGYFTPLEVRAPLRHILRRADYDIPHFSHHLMKFVEHRGQVLQVAGTERQKRFRFSDPLLKPFVVVKGLDAGLVEAQDLLAWRVVNE
ncbi:MAG TPA: AAA family ATPase [Chloroflexota bacterium]|nr:AAA family ATPase [Chloroflexota bacterium]